MRDKRFCVIMAGGNGNRFWPICREERPKQFLDISETGKSFVRAAYDRCTGLVPKENILIVTLAKYRSLVEQQVPDLPPENLLLEPYGRKTGPCIAYATYAILKRNPDAVVAVTPADHVISDTPMFRETILNALEYVDKHPVLMTLGVVPDRPDPNYGYIQAAGGKGDFHADKPVKVKTFTEKPDKSLAEVFFNSGEFFWNSGIFVWRAAVIREEMEKYIPEVTRLFRGWEGAIGSPSEGAFLERAYADITKISIDYGVMEKTDRAWIYPVRFGWSDIDNWASLYSVLPDKDSDGNASNAGKRYFQDGRNNIIFSKDKKKLVAVKGLENFMVIDTDDVLMICPKDDNVYKDFIAGTALPGFDKFR